MEISDDPKTNFYLQQKNVKENANSARKK